MIYVITGTSSGIGKAIAEFYLEKGSFVIGISRRNTIEHPHYFHISCDFSKLEELQALTLPKELIQANAPICLINNAGVIGQIGRVENQSLQNYTEVALVNTVAVQYLCTYVIQHFGYKQINTIISISSGAGQYPISSWAAYCASKASINLFMETLHKEIQELGENTHVFSLSPGVVDTEMQEKIRSSNASDFSRHSEFVELKESQKLRSPKEVASLLDEFLTTIPHEGIIFRL